MPVEGTGDHPLNGPPGGIMEVMESQMSRPGHLTAHQTAQLLGISPEVACSTG